MDQKEYLKMIGENIKKYRKIAGMTQSNLGFEIDLNKSNIAPIEKGKVNITIGTLLKIANALEIDGYKLLKRED